MKKYFLSLALLLFFFSAQPGLAEGFSGPGSVPARTMVSDLGNLADDTMVVLTGKIEKQLKDDEYQFNDGTGTVVVEIDHDVWMGLTVGPEDIVEIQGELDKELMSRKVDVKRITKQ
ncbi:NirD/YgiW/YdeI family stress tolerance protein [Deltaproteobacteria bacterium OttesenSCG-928-M10]|nr:NirD/YgiW/YdeI family stress tolerance protein [Deltaproteobacteria bacterium OttesenSCG-928-M10]